jgi:hypothetical protein
VEKSFLDNASRQQEILMDFDLKDRRNLNPTIFEAKAASQPIDREAAMSL